MVKGFAYKKDLLTPDAGFHIWPKDGGFGNYTAVIILEAEKVEELKDLIRSLRVLVDPSDEYYAEEALAVLEGEK